MSRQFDETIQNKFEYNEEMYSLVEEIKNVADLAEAFKILDILNDCERQYEPDSGHPCFWMIRQQEEVIKEYMDTVGEFDNSIFLANLSYLLREHNIRVGELEQILGISSGYISRTAKQGSAKKLSIDVVWKIAALFKVSLEDLLKKNIATPESNSEIIARFLAKVTHETEAHVVEWENGGGAMSYLEDRFKSLPLFTEEDDGTVVYHPDKHMNPDYKWTLADDIYYTKDIASDKEFVMIAFSHGEDENNYMIDFIFVWPEKVGNKTIYHWEKAFYSSDDRFGRVEEQAEWLMDKVQTQEMDASLSHEVRNLISGYLNKEG